MTYKVRSEKAIQLPPCGHVSSLSVLRLPSYESVWKTLRLHADREMTNWTLAVPATCYSSSRNHVAATA